MPKFLCSVAFLKAIILLTATSLSMCGHLVTDVVLQCTAFGIDLRCWNLKLLNFWHRSFTFNSNKKPETATAVIELLMMGGKTAKTCLCMLNLSEARFVGLHCILI
jgi:hypothetical protein